MQRGNEATRQQGNKARRDRAATVREWGRPRSDGAIKKMKLGTKVQLHADLLRPGRDAPTFLVPAGTQ